MAYVHQLLHQPLQWQTSQQAGPGSVPEFTSTSITAKQLQIKNKNFNQSKSNLLIWYLLFFQNLFLSSAYLYKNLQASHIYACILTSHSRVSGPQL